jgi:hypothetical protein
MKQYYSRLAIIAAALLFAGLPLAAAGTGPGASVLEVQAQGDSNHANPSLVESNEPADSPDSVIVTDASPGTADDGEAAVEAADTKAGESESDDAVVASAGAPSQGSTDQESEAEVSDAGTADGEVHSAEAPEVERPAGGASQHNEQHGDMSGSSQAGDGDD